MKYLLLALMIMPDGEARGLAPESWHDSESECAVSGEEFRQYGMSLGAEAVRFDCLEFKPEDLYLWKFIIENELTKR